MALHSTHPSSTFESHSEVWIWSLFPHPCEFSTPILVREILRLFLLPGRPDHPLKGGYPVLVEDVSLRLPFLTVPFRFCSGLLSLTIRSSPLNGLEHAAVGDQVEEGLVSPRLTFPPPGRRPPLHRVLATGLFLLRIEGGNVDTPLWSARFAPPDSPLANSPFFLACADSPESFPLIRWLGLSPQFSTTCATTSSPGFFLSR